MRIMKTSSIVLLCCALLLMGTPTRAARDFTKNTSNFMSLGSGTVGPLVNGAAQISMHVRVTFDAIETTNATNDRMFQALINTNGTGLVIASNAPAGSPLLRIGARSVSTDSLQVRQGTTTLPTGTSLSLGGMIDIAGDTITPYYQGVAENSGAVTFANTTYTHGTTTADDSIGANLAVAVATSGQVDGRIAEVAVWTMDIGAVGFLQLSWGASPLEVHPEALVFYKPLYGNVSPEPDLFGGVGDTITGSVPKADHPKVYYYRR